MRNAMRISALTVLVVLAATTHALPELQLIKRGASNAVSRPAKGRVKRGAGTLGTNVFDVLTYTEGGAYYINVTVGSPPQEQTVLLSTGAGELYFDASTAQACSQPSSDYNSCRGGTFNASASSTYHNISGPSAFNVSFGDGTFATGPFGEDTVGISDVSLNNVQFGVAQQVNSTSGHPVGLLGLGYSTNEDAAFSYPNMPEVMVDTGIINSRLYSIFLNDIGETSGSVLFGGIDTSKYTGQLATLNLLPNQSTTMVNQFITTVTGLSAYVGGKPRRLFSGGTDGVAAYQSNNTAFPALLNTGSTPWAVPTYYYSQYIAPLFPYVDSQGRCSCNNRNTSDLLTIEFGATLNITVPAREFIVPLYNISTNQPETSNGSSLCGLMISGSKPTEGIFSLGDAIMRSMYAVFDLDNGQVSLAQAAFDNSGNSNVQTVAAGPSGVASAAANVIPASPNTNSIAAAATQATLLIASTIQSTVGTATGTAALPTDAQISGGSATATSNLTTTSAVSTSSSTNTTSSSAPITAPNAVSSTASTTAAPTTVTTTAPMPAPATSSKAASSASSSARASIFKGAAAVMAVSGVDWSTVWTTCVAVVIASIGARVAL